MFGDTQAVWLRTMNPTVQRCRNQQVTFMLEDTSDLLDGIERVERVLDDFHTDHHVIGAVSDELIGLGDIAHQCRLIGVNNIEGFHRKVMKAFPDQRTLLWSDLQQAA